MTTNNPVDAHSFATDLVSAVADLDDSEVAVMLRVVSDAGADAFSPRIGRVFNAFAAILGAEDRARFRRTRQWEQDVLDDRVEGWWGPLVDGPADDGDTGGGGTVR